MKKKEGNATVYRCGKLRCPEVLAKQGPLKMNVTPGYDRNRAGVFIKTRRTGSRIKHQQEYVEDCIMPLWIEEYLHADAVQEKRIIEATKGIPFVTTEAYLDAVLAIDMSAENAKENAARKYYRDARRGRDDIFGFPADVDDFPLTIRCGRCGNVSIIKCTD